MNAADGFILASGAALLVMLLAPTRRREPFESGSGQQPSTVVPPPATPRYGLPPPPALGPVYPNPDGTRTMLYGATYRADFSVSLPSFLVSEDAVTERLEAEGFTVHSCEETTPARFLVIATRTGANESLEVPGVVEVHSLERIR